MKTINKPNLIEILMYKGAKLEYYKTYGDRSKVSGQMWGGEAKLLYNNMAFLFELWHHGTNNETPESLLPNFSLKGIQYPKGYYSDFHWHGFMASDGIYLHHIGWFKNKELANHPFIKAIPNRNLYGIELTAGEKAVIAALGFKRVLAI